MNLPINLKPNVRYDPEFLQQSEADRLLELLTDSLDWRQDSISLFGKTHLIPRLQAFIAGPHVSYTYSGLTLLGTGFPAALSSLKNQIEQHAGHRFNALLANLYRDGKDHMGWHSDDERELGSNPVIASLSLGAQRTFRLRHKQQKHHTIDYELTHGSLLIMGKDVQHQWDHSLPKRLRVHEPRINLTFRLIIE